jgi:hypothetical protein
VFRQARQAGRRMEPHRKTAMIVGVLFIIATVTALLGTVLTQSSLNASDYLDKISANQNQVIIGVLFKFIAAAASAGIAISLYPILKKYNEGLALGSVGFRLIEGVFYIVAALGLLSLLSLSQEYASAGSPAASTFQILGTLMLAVRNWASQSGVIAFTVGVLMYYYVFYQSKLIPRFISGWGFIGAALSLAAVLLTFFDQLVPFSTVFILFNFPIFLQEMVLAVWLIVKGFNPSVIASGSAKTATNELLSAS